MGFFRSTRTFLAFWLGQTLSQLGSGMTAFALIIWAYGERGTVMSVALLSVCSYVPRALVSALAGSFVDRAPKKALMLLSDGASALVTLAVLLLHANGALRVEHLYAFNALLGAAGAVQQPASNVAATLLVPKEYYMRVSGLQSLGGSLMGILTPILATATLAFGGLRSVIVADLASFALAFGSLICIAIPATKAEGERAGGGASLREGLRYLKGNAGVRHIIWYLGLINLIAGVGYYSVLSPMILARTGGDEVALGMVSGCMGLGAAAGALALAAYAPRVGKVKLMCVCYMLSFIMCDCVLGLGRSLPVWCAAAFLGNITLPHGDGALSTLLRCGVPVDMQGRVFAARYALVNLCLTAGYLLGGVLADAVAAPLVAHSALLTRLLGVGDGRAMGVIYLFTGVTGSVASLALLRDPALKPLEALAE